MVLVVDDEQNIRTVLRMGLERAGYSVLEAVDGAQALELLALPGHQVSIVISDVMMPGVDGLELVERLGRMHPEIPVVLASGFHTRTAMAAGGAHRLAGYLHKPYDVSAVLGVVSAALTRGPDA